MPAMATTVSTTVLKSVPLFATFPDEQLRTLVTVVTRRSAPRASVIMAAGDQIDSLYIVISGRLKAMMIGASREMVSRVMKDLQMGGYIEMRGSTIVLRDNIMLRD